MAQGWVIHFNGCRCRCDCQLTIWFALHLLFAQVNEQYAGAIRLYIPELDSINPSAVLLSIMAAILIFRLKWNVIKTLAVTSLTGLALGFIG